MFRKLANWVTSHPKKIITVWILILIAGGYFAAILPSALTAGGFNDPNSESMQAKAILQSNFDDKYPQNFILVVESKKENINSISYENYLSDLQNKMMSYKHVKEVKSYYDTNLESFLSEDKKTTYLIAGLDATEDQAANLVPQIKKGMQEIEKDGYKVWLTGGPALNYALNDATKKEVTKAEMIAFPAMIVILLFVFRTVASTVIPLMMSMFALGTTMAVCYFIAQQFTLNILITNIISMIGLGVIVDYALFIISRFKQELEKKSVKFAVVKTMETAGRAVFYSGLTVAISLSALFIPDMLIFNSIAIGGVLVVLFAVLVSLTLLPAILTIIGPKVNWGKVPFLTQKKQSNSKWERFAYRLMKRPVLFLIPALLLLIGVAMPSLQVNMQVPVASASVLPEGTPEREGFEVLTSKFSQGDMFPIEVVLKSDSSITSSANLDIVDKLTRNIESLKGVEKVTSITNWNKEMNVKDYEKIYTNIDQMPQEAAQQIGNILNIKNGSDTTVLYIASENAADSKASHTLVKKVRALAEETMSTSELSFFVGGETATGLDFDEKVFENLPWIIASVFLISFIVLVVSFKSIILPLKAILLNSLVTLASLGVLVFGFQYDFSFSMDASQTINSITPVVLFAVLFGLSMDYEVIIIHRIKELYEEGLNNDDSIAKGISETAGLVNGAAAIMIAVFGAFALIDIKIVAELGLGLAFAILIDALLVRTIFVPALMKLFGRLNWWIPFQNRAPSLEIRKKIS